MGFRKAALQYSLGRKVYAPTPTPEDVREFWSFMCDRHRVRLVNKWDSREMDLVGAVLDRMGILSKKSFLESYSTTVVLSASPGPMRAIYTPFTVGEGDERILWGQMRTCVHEIDHVLQADRSGEIGYAWSYLSNPATRAHYEMEAYRSEMEMEWRYRGRMLDPKDLARKIEHYGCSLADIEIMESGLRRSIPVIRANCPIEPAFKEAVKWLDERYEWVV